MVATALQPHVPGTSRTSNIAGNANAAQPSILETLGAQPTAAEQQRVSDLQEQFQQQAQKDPAGFRLALRAAFGDKASPAQIDQLLDLALLGKLPMPSNIQFVEAGSLGSGALGAYDANNGGSLYLDRSLLSDPSKLQSVFNEEMGHHLDALLGGADAAGDEGAVFSRTLESGTLSQRELTALKSEDDHGYIDVNGKQVAVEFRNEDEGSGNGQSGSDTSGGSGGGGADSGGGADAGGGTDTSGGSGGGGADSGGGADAGGGAESGAGECSAHDTSGDDTGSEDSVDKPEEPDSPPSGRQSDNRDDEKDGKQETNSTGGPPGSGEAQDGDDTVEGDNGRTAGEDGTTTADGKENVAISAATTVPVAAAPSGFWSGVGRGIASAFSFVGLGTATTGAGLIGLFYPRPVGEGSDVVPDDAMQAVTPADDQEPDNNEGVEEAEETESTNATPDLPADPNGLLDQGFVDTSHPDAAANGHRTFENPVTGETIRFDEGEEGRDGHAGRDHYHVENPNATGRHDQYLDKDGKPVAKGSNASHLYKN